MLRDRSAQCRRRRLRQRFSMRPTDERGREPDLENLHNHCWRVRPRAGASCGENTVASALVTSCCQATDVDGTQPSARVTVTHLPTGHEPFGAPSMLVGRHKAMSAAGFTTTY